MSEPMYLGGDPASYANTSEGTQEVECGNDECAYAVEVTTTEEYAHKEVTWYAEWTCPKCGEKNEKEGWYDPYDDN